MSLHGHTNHSKEGLQFIPEFAQRFSLLQWALEKQKSVSLLPVDFDQAYWTPPLTPKQAYDLESGQIENVLGLASIVSLTDHDNIEAPALLRLVPEVRHVPLSLEWSVPFRGTIFHLGIHNLPEGNAAEIVADLAFYTLNPNEKRLTELLASLDEDPDVLIVFNHPLWEQRSTGGQAFAQTVEQFLEVNCRFLHALELNATRSWKENYRALQLAERWGRPVVSGGDRHATEPSAVLNFTEAESLPEFIHEIRDGGLSHIVFMPQYQEPLCLRTMKTLLDIIREYPENPVGSRRWDDRVFHPGRPRELMQPLSALWRRPPVAIERIFSIFRLAENDSVGRALKLMLTEDLEPNRPIDFPSEALL
ncbi:MAG: hypothetical protein WAM91_09360 [Candidatus Acidiferrales bacterium]